MECTEARELFTRVVLGELGAADMLKAERHMADCKECRAWEKDADVVVTVERSVFVEIILE